MIDKLIERYPKLEVLFLPILVFIAGLVIFLMDSLSALPLGEIGIGVMSVGLGSNADFRWFAKKWIMTASPELHERLYED